MSILTIAASDSGSGAGIQADLLTLAAFGFQGVCAVTAVTSQSPREVKEVLTLPSGVVADQIQTAVEDYRVEWAKTGMLATQEIVGVVVELVKRYRLKVVVDPVLKATSGALLLEKPALRTLKEELLPLAVAVTPNRGEAEVLSGIKIRDRLDAERAARVIGSLGVEAVIVKGGHTDGVDLLYQSEDGFTYLGERGHLRECHGTGCVYSAALTAGLAMGSDFVEAAALARDFVAQAVLGARNQQVFPLHQTLRERENFRALESVKKGVELLEENPYFYFLIPEVGSNLAVAPAHASTPAEVAAVQGRIVKYRGRPKAVGCPELGASSHIARIVLTAMKYDPQVRACLNIKYTPETLEACRKLGLTISSFYRGEEPPETSTMEWGVSYAVQSLGGVPQVIYDTGDLGKEAMIRILGKNGVEVAETAVRIAEKEKEQKK